MTAAPGAVQSRERRARGRWRLEVVPLALDAIAEGTWLAVVYLAVQVLLARGTAYLGPVELTACAALGIVVARRWKHAAPRAVAVAAVSAALVGWVLAAPARAALGALDPAGFLGAHPGGWIAGVAVARGAAHADRGSDDLVVSGLLSWGLLVLALPWLLAQVTPQPWRGTFDDAAFVSTLAFVVAALLAVAVARLDALGESSGVDWRTNRSWLGLLVALVALMVVVGVPLAAIVGVPLDAAIRGALGPLWIAAVAVVTVLALPVGIVLGALVTALLAIIPKGEEIIPPVHEQLGQPFTPSTGQTSGAVVAIGAVLVVAAVLVLILVLALRLLPDRSPTPEEAGEEREIVMPAGSIRVRLPLPRITRPQRHPAPHDAATAYVAALDSLGADASRARIRDETPAAHARRLRAADRGSLALDLLAADYQLARYAGRDLSHAENRRGIRRWRSIRDQATRRAPADTEAARGPRV